MSKHNKNLTNPHLALALEMARRGIAVVPFARGTHRPLTPDWGTAATTDEALIKGWAAHFPSCWFGRPVGPPGDAEPAALVWSDKWDEAAVAGLPRDLVAALAALAKG